MGRLPDDVRAFYEYFGGAVFFEEEAFSYEIVGPSEMRRSDVIVLGEELSDPELAEWYAFLKCRDQLVSLNLHAGDDYGSYYDSPWDSFGIKDEGSLVARSLAELIDGIVASEGRSIFWIDGHF
ncbi:MAG TPA: hypothetical protein PLZ93_14855 [Nocardioides sp.]|uniref:hypothetical protein n=1 Tax=uncultured Nocardioides sp. TaxID=198441 RepID=UPI000EE24039|nr:hypothetical protein [uncultured Nocardioides sp.]HCB04120.1 hypothetical protein [Nocardioides sp.]HRD62030.1 hypothetical protein [Nocardioides sp.]HRI96893.1 hypothetical protein [Nocardioides sp.]HRK46622.1 hypothetical protein [Nocardioides sp.]